jgi:hypothetical protein
MTPFFSIITASLQRESLIRCCESVDSQQLPSWQHIVALDCLPGEVNDDLIDRILHPQRVIFCCGKKYGNFGNHARWMAWEKATGTYLYTLDDDNAMFHPNALADMARCLTSAGLPDFAIFPIHRHGSIFFHDPPGLCMTDTGNYAVKREIGRWPDIEAREADGHFVESLKAKYKYAAFPECEAIMMMEKSSGGL